ncbi:MAG: hypothetical protein ABI467_18880 [Kofleriaceae bacterium]
MNADDRLLARLLAGRDRLSRSEKDALLDGTLAAVAPRSRIRWPWLALPALAAAVALVMIAPWRVSAPSSDFTARGGAAPVAVLHVTCAAGCTHGDKLVFDLHGTSAYRYFAAFAKRGDGTVLWYFPAADDATSVDLTTLPPSGVLDRGIVLGAEHPPGTYRIYGVFSHVPLARAAIRAAFDATRLTAGAGTQVVTTDVEVR